MNQHPLWYLHLLELGLLVAIFNSGNDKFGVKNLDLVLGSDILPWFEATLKEIKKFYHGIRVGAGPKIWYLCLACG